MMLKLAAREAKVLMLILMLRLMLVPKMMLIFKKTAREANVLMLNLMLILVPEMLLILKLTAREATDADVDADANTGT